MYEAQIGDAADPLYRQSVLAAMDGNYVQSGCNVTIDDSSTDVVLNIGSGTVFINDTETDIQSQSVVLDGGGATDARKDTIYLGADGNANVEKGPLTDTQNGQPPAPQTDDGQLFPARQLWHPAPPPVPITDGPVIASVLVKANTSDSTDLDGSDVVDRRIRGVDVTEFARVNDNGDVVSDNGFVNGEGNQMVATGDSVGVLNTSSLDSDYPSIDRTTMVVDDSDISTTPAGDAVTGHQISVDTAPYLGPGGTRLSFDVHFAGSAALGNNFDRVIYGAIKVVVTKQEGGSGSFEIANQLVQSSRISNGSGNLSSTDRFDFTFDTNQGIVDIDAEAVLRTIKK